MCGLAGIVDVRESRPIDRTLLRAMNDTLTHRGPDGDGLHLEPGVGLAHRRLSIIDLAAGEQPMFNEDGSVCIVYNGEIYNFRELADELTGLGHRFRTRCDTEVIVHAWEQWGPGCVTRFNGMFAFALWDRNQRRLLLARDRLGIKPLYYAELPTGFIIFASELKAIMRHPDTPRSINPAAIEEYLAFGYIPEPNSIYSGIHKLEPGHVLDIDVTGRHRAPAAYWDVDFNNPLPGKPAFADIQAELIERFRTAVRRRLIADVPLGAFLSGGVDSSAVAAMMVDLIPEKVRTCSIAFDDPQYDESSYARLVAEQKGTDHIERTVRVDDFSLLDRLVDIYDEPYADSSAIPTYRVCGVARESVTVALSGDGGDENFVGYRRYRLFMGEEAVRSRIPAGMRCAIFGPLGHFYPKLDWAPRIFRGKTTFQSLARDSVGAYLHGVSILSGDIRRTLYSDAFKKRLQGYDAREVFDRHVTGKQFPDTLSMIQYLDLKTYLVGDILTKVDRASMAHSLEVRVPFLDHEFVEWAARLPSTLKLKGGEGKYVLKKSLEPYLPASVLYRKKMGFAVPLVRWFRGPLADRVRDLPASPWLADAQIFDRKALDTICSQHLSGRRNHTDIIWALLMLEGFLRNSADA